MPEQPPPEPMELVAAWCEHARASGVPEHRAMVLATADDTGAPSARTVLASAIDAAGVTFHSSHPSRKTRDLAANPRAGAVFGWYAVSRQVVLAGAVADLPDEECDTAYAARDAGLRLLAWAYHREVGAEDLPAALERERDRWGDRVPERPPSWRGYRLRPDVVDFWYADGTGDGATRARVRYRRDDPGPPSAATGAGGWRIGKVLP